MANADFEPKKAASGGFDASSYRTVEQNAPSRSLTPFQKKLAGLEKALPGALRTRAAALLLTLVIVAGSAVGVGGFKLRSRYNEARSWYTLAANNGDPDAQKALRQLKRNKAGK